MEPTIVQSGMVSGELAAKVKLAFAMALLERSEIDPAVLDLEGMSGRKYRHFVNNLIRSLANASYLEVGIWRGSTLCAAISRNDVQATAIDDWSQYGRARDEFHANLDRFRSPGARVTVIECDYRNINFYKIGRHLVYLLMDHIPLTINATE